MRQGVPDNRFSVCEELTFSRTFRKNSAERNKQDLNSQLNFLNDIFIYKPVLQFSYQGSSWYCTNETHAAATAQKYKKPRSG